MIDELRLALPSKGELEEDTTHFMAACGLRVDRTNPRQYTARIPAAPGVRVLFQRAADILAKVEEGSADIGITGLDIVGESAPEESSTIYGPESRPIPRLRSQRYLSSTLSVMMRRNS